jgi:hypothetical protein
MKIVKKIWPIVLNLLVVFVALAIFDSLYEEGSVITVAICLMILTSIQSGIALHTRTAMTVAAENQKSFAMIMRKLGNAIEAEELEADSALISNALRESQYKLIINSIGSAVIWFIAVISILGSI